MAEPRLVTVCSRIPGIAAAVRALQVPGLRVEAVDPSSLGPSTAHSTDFLIAEHDLLGPVLHCPTPARLQWVQSTWAGVDSLARMVQPGTKPTLRLARFAHASFSQLMAEYCLVSVLSMERNYPGVHRAQASRTWDTSPALRSYRCLDEVTVAVLGLGQTGAATAAAFAGLGCRVLALVRSPRPASGHVARYYTREELPELLAAADYVLAMLPATPATDSLLGGAVLAHCRGAGLVSLGRGNLCSEAELLAALAAGHLRAAALDVFPIEPLPADSPLWTHPKVVVTPHLAALSRPSHIAECFGGNLARHLSGQSPDCLVDWEQLY